ncbi:ABC transporter ATP-binding protein [Mycoplasma todarodis]|uniref:ABC transporter domain-containing protein n=1 Tax=Mycoplasma todarodis TaxID=1937191 RepID=A0A4R0XML7_9MOLU|nr:ATP-binding cassette domain-containing protein [Mycoplasma todarodis]TCG11963.1 hypothetical protein C4B25_00465 [Mycoplasma todarodis]
MKNHSRKNGEERKSQTLNKEQTLREKLAIKVRRVKASKNKDSKIKTQKKNHIGENKEQTPNKEQTLSKKTEQKAHKGKAIDNKERKKSTRNFKRDNNEKQEISNENPSKLKGALHNIFTKLKNVLLNIFTRLKSILLNVFEKCAKRFNEYKNNFNNREKNIQANSNEEVKHTLELIDIEQTFKKNRILKKCNFKVSKGSFHALIGENGAGKTTLIKTIIGGYPNYNGKILFNEQDIKKNITQKDILSYVPEVALFPNGMNTFKYLLWIATLKGIEKNEAIENIERLMESFNLTEFGNTNPNKLSSGQKKRIFLVKIILEKPELVILDEPAANLDPTARYLFFEELKRLNDEGVTILITSHIVAEISKYVDEVTMVKKGEIAYTGQIKKGQLEAKFKEIILDSHSLLKGGW